MAPILVQVTQGPVGEPRSAAYLLSARKANCGGLYRLIVLAHSFKVRASQHVADQIV